MTIDKLLYSIIVYYSGYENGEVIHRFYQSQQSNVPSQNIDTKTYTDYYDGEYVWEIIQALFLTVVEAGIAM